MSCQENISLSRRRMLQGAAASLALWGNLPKAVAGTRDPRLLVMILRGGLDGLALAGPVGDPDYARLRSAIALTQPGSGPNAGLALDNMFALNPSLPYLHGLYSKGEASIFHAIASPYRERSHFDGQDVLENGMPGIKLGGDGWLNRALSGMSQSGRASPKGLAMGAMIPLVMRGKADVLSWIPKTLNLPLRDSTIARVMDLYTHTDPSLAKAFSEGIKIEQLATADGMMQAQPASAQPAQAMPVKAGAPVAQAGGPAPGPVGQRPYRDFIDTAEAAAKFLSSADGPRVGALSYNGWDTHANEGTVGGQLGNRLSGLDAAIKVFAEGMGATWKDTAVLVVTEFGRTARVNGTSGTDHGTATTALLLGGAVKGGRVIADWPGLSEASLYENRDLKPTRDLRTVFKGVLRDHLGIPAGALSETVFPESAKVAPMDGLLV